MLRCPDEDRSGKAACKPQDLRWVLRAEMRRMEHSRKREKSGSQNEEVADAILYLWA